MVSTFFLTGTQTSFSDSSSAIRTVNNNDDNNNNNIITAVWVMSMKYDHVGFCVFVCVPGVNWD